VTAATNHNAGTVPAPSFSILTEAIRKLRGR
jgi:hypothetical protein